MKKEILNIRSILRQGLQNDYNIELYNFSEYSGYYTISFYHGNSVYNALAYASTHERDNSTCIDAQYAKSNQKMNILVKRLCNNINKFISNGGKWSIIETEFEHYNKLFEMVFNAKYSISENLYCYGMGE